MERGSGFLGRAGESLRHGLFSRIFTSYGQIEDVRKRGFFSALGKMARTSRTMARVRRAVSRSIEGSFILRRVRRAAAALPWLTMRAYGMFFFSFGFYISIICAIKAISSTMTFDTDVLVTGVVTMLLSVPLLLSTKTFAGAVLSSRFASYIAFDILGYRREEAERDAETRSRADATFLLGMVAGLLTFYLDPHEVMGIILSLLLIYVVFSKPETGLMLLFALFPFFPDRQLSSLVILILFSYIIKLVCGRRTLVFDTVDTFMLVFFVLFALGGAVNYGAGTGVAFPARRVLYMTVFFLVSNLITNDSWRTRLVRTLMFGGSALAVASLFGIIADNVYAFAAKSASPGVADLALWSAGRVADAEASSYYLAMMLPVMMAYLSRRDEGGKRLNMAFFSIVTVAAAVFTMSRGLWFGTIVGVLVMLIVIDLRFALLPIVGGVAVPIGMLVLPDSVLSSAASVLDVTGYATVWRASVRRLSGRIFLDNLIGGIGSGEGVFYAVYDQSSPVGASAGNAQSLFLEIACELGVFGLLAFLLAVVFLLIKAFTAASLRPDIAARRCAGALASGFTAVLVIGLSNYTWVDDRMLLLFFMFAGAVSAYCGERGCAGASAPERVPGDVLGDAETASLDICDF